MSAQHNRQVHNNNNNHEQIFPECLIVLMLDFNENQCLIHVNLNFFTGSKYTHEAKHTIHLLSMSKPRIKMSTYMHSNYVHRNIETQHR